LKHAAVLQGFQQLKVLRNARAVSCFVEFDTLENATACHQSQQVSGLLPIIMIVSWQGLLACDVWTSSARHMSAADFWIRPWGGASMHSHHHAAGQLLMDNKWARKRANR
jgi:hypothetical protein